MQVHDQNDYFQVKSLEQLRIVQTVNLDGYEAGYKLQFYGPVRNSVTRMVREPISRGVIQSNVSVPNISWVVTYSQPNSLNYKIE